MVTEKVIFLLFGIFAWSFAVNPCVQRKISGADLSVYCVCNSTYCDEIEPLGELKNSQIAIYLSSSDGKRLDRQNGEFAKQMRKDENVIEIKINASMRYQTLLGFGGAFTDAAGINLNKLSVNARKSLIEQYYGGKGIQYTLGRVPIASCDFSTRQYSYCDQVDDFELKTFALAKEDYEAKIPFIIEAINLTKGQLKLYASPWSPPAWFKTNNKMAGPGTLKNSENGTYYQSYAKYFIKFFEEYAKNGIIFWGLTTQNEPASGLIPFYPWQTMWLSPLDQQQFIKNYLGPYLRRNKATSKIKIMVNDDNLLFVPSYTNAILNDSETAKYIDGIGIHWYLSDITGREQLVAHHKAHPDVFILSTEACTGSELFNHGPILGSWERGDRYARDIIAVLQRWAVGWTDWNLALDLKGGPNWAKNFVDAPVIVNSTADEFYKNPMFYVLGHFSKFIPPGSIRINSTINSTNKNKLDAVSFVTPENQRVLVVLNSNNNESYKINIKESKQSFNYQMPPSSIATFIWNKKSE